MAETETRPRRDVDTSRDRDVETETTSLVYRQLYKLLLPCHVTTSTAISRAMQIAFHGMCGHLHRHYAGRYIGYNRTRHYCHSTARLAAPSNGLKIAVIIGSVGDVRFQRTTHTGRREAGLQWTSVGPSTVDTALVHWHIHHAGAWPDPTPCARLTTSERPLIQSRPARILSQDSSPVANNMCCRRRLLLLMLNYLRSELRMLLSKYGTTTVPARPDLHQQTGPRQTSK